MHLGTQQLPVWAIQAFVDVCVDVFRARARFTSPQTSHPSKFDDIEGARSPSENYHQLRSERRGVGCKAARRRRCRGASSRSANAADGPTPPEPEGRLGVAVDICVARRRRCAPASPPPRALISPRKPQARNWGAILRAPGRLCREIYSWLERGPMDPDRVKTFGSYPLILCRGLSRVREDSLSRGSVSNPATFPAGPAGLNQTPIINRAANRARP